VEEAVDLLLEHRRLDLSQSSDKGQILGTCQIGIEVRGLGYIADSPAVFEQVLLDVPTVVADRAVGRRQQTGHHLDGRRFARPVGTQIAEHFPRARNETDLLHSRQCAIVFGDTSQL